MFSSGVRAVGVEKDFYTLEKLEDPYCWERTYATCIEPLMGKLFRKIISRTNRLVPTGTVILNDSEKIQLAAVMVMQLLRGKQTREFERDLFQAYSPDAFEKAKKKFGPLNEEQLKLSSEFATNEYYFKHISMDLAFDMNRITMFSEALYNRTFLFLRICGNAEFITSDNPVLFINGRTGNARPFSNGLLHTSTVVYYPISPKLLLCALHPESFWGTLSDQDCHIVELDSHAEENFFATINRKQVAQCFRHSFARSLSSLEKYRKTYH